MITYLAVIGHDHATEPSYVTENVSNAWDTIKTNFEGILAQQLNETFNILVPDPENPQQERPKADVIELVEHLKGPALAFFCEGLDENASHSNSIIMHAPNS
jgi:hypothetical protein